MNWRQFLRFGVVGVLQNGCNVASFAALVALGVDFRIAAVVAAVVGLATSFVLNRSWTFAGAAKRRLHAQAVRYTIVFAAATLLGVGVLWVLVSAGVPEVGGQALAILIVAPLSYVTQLRWSFGR